MSQLDDGPGPICLFCGEPERVSLSEIWTDHTFMVETCCAGLHASIVQEMADDPVWGRDLLRHLGAERLTGHRLRRLADDGGCGSILDWQLEYRSVAFQTARCFVRQHHRHCGAPAAWRFGMSLFNGPTMLGVVMVGNPVAPALCGRSILEVTDSASVAT